MKKITLLFFAMLLSFSVFSQRANTIFTEDFSSAVPPAGWTIDGISAQWDQAATANAGGVAPEARLTYVSGTNTTRFISPETDLSGFTSVIFSFRHFLDDYSGTGYTIGVATRSGGGSWNDVWTINPTGNMGPETRDVIISNADVGTSDFQVCIFLSGNTFNFDYWFIDDLSLIVSDSNDAIMQSINVLPYAEPGDIDIMCTVKNLGLNNITSADINYQIDSETIVTDNLTGLNLVTTESLNHTFTTPWSASSGTYSLKVWISNMNGAGDDDDISNDTLTQTMGIATESTQKLPLFEEFTSSTCGPCASFNGTSFNAFIAANESSLSLIKYQMSWPGSGDPYYTAEGGVRRAYYGVSGVPTTYLDGNDPNFFGNPSLLQPELDAALLQPSFFEMSANYEVDGDNIEVVINIMPYISVGMTVHIAVIERITTENATTNGETEFENVMMKMLPDAYGTLVNFVAEENSTLSETFDMSSTFVEEMSDLAVVVFIQDDNNTKGVMQSVNATEGGIGMEEIHFQNVSVYPNPAIDNLNIKNAEGLSIAIFDLLGRELLVKENLSVSEKVSVSDLSEGTYLLQLSDGINSRTEKIVIAR